MLPGGEAVSHHAQAEDGCGGDERCLENLRDRNEREQNILAPGLDGEIFRQLDNRNELQQYSEKENRKYPCSAKDGPFL